MLTLATPFALLLLPLPFLLMRLLPPSSAAAGALIVPDKTAHWFERQGKETRNPVMPTAKLLPLLVWLLIVVALAGPRLMSPTPALPVTGRDLFLALDLSGSMVREDFFLEGEEISRLEAVQRVGSQFVRGRGGDRVGLVVFGSDAYVAAPLSYDVETLAATIEETVIGISGRATNIGDGLGLAMKRLQATDAASRVVVLLSDGSNNAGTARPRDVAALAPELGVRLHTIALGPKDIASAEKGERGVVDAATLAAMAELGGGQAYRVKTFEDLEAVTRAIDALESTERAGTPAELFRPLWIYSAALAALLLIAIPVARQSHD